MNVAFSYGDDGGKNNKYNSRHLGKLCLCHPIDVRSTHFPNNRILEYRRYFFANNANSSRVVLSRLDVLFTRSGEDRGPPDFC